MMALYLRLFLQTSLVHYNPMIRIMFVSLRLWLEQVKLYIILSDHNGLIARQFDMQLNNSLLQWIYDNITTFQQTF